jgi:glycosyltransferase involved in cell wall biosynthesis
VNPEPSSPANSLTGHWVVIPAYNEARTIRDVANRSLQEIEKVIVVDDGSTDGTAQALVGLPVILLRNYTNRGKAGSLCRGFEHALGAGASGVVTLDGDGQHAPEDIPKLLAAAARYPTHLIIGARHHDQRRAFIWRYAANRAADFWISWAAGHRFEDSQSGFRVYPASLLRSIKIESGKARSFVFESEFLIEASRAGYGNVPVPVEVVYCPGLRPSHFRPVLDITRITRMVAWKLIAYGMYPMGLYRSVFGAPSCPSRGGDGVEEVPPDESLSLGRRNTNR